MVSTVVGYSDLKREVEILSDFRLFQCHPWIWPIKAIQRQSKINFNKTKFSIPRVEKSMPLVKY